MVKTIIAFALIAALLFAGCTSPEEDEMPPAPPSGNGSANSTTQMTEQLCKSSGGNWNGCGSACRGAPEGTACITLCVPYCECGGIAGFSCPAGFECTDYLPSNTTPDAMGICKPASS